MYVTEQTKTSSPDSTPFRPGFPECSAIHSSSQLSLFEGELEISTTIFIKDSRIYIKEKVA